MTWAIPNWYALVLLALAGFRIWHLLAHDVIFDPIRNRIVRADTKREEFVKCPYCFGWWVALILWLFWVWEPHWTLVVCTPFAISAVLALVASNLDGE